MSKYIVPVVTVLEVEAEFESEAQMCAEMSIKVDTVAGVKLVKQYCKDFVAETGETE